LRPPVPTLFPYTTLFRSADYATAVGSGSNALATGASAFGSGAFAGGEFATANGYGATAAGNNSVASGSNATAAGDSSVAVGGELYIVDELTGEVILEGGPTQANEMGAVALGSGAQGNGAFSLANGTAAIAD